jgi:hypothetical protein
LGLVRHRGPDTGEGVDHHPGEVEPDLLGVARPVGRESSASAARSVRSLLVLAQPTRSPVAGGRP